MFSSYFKMAIRSLSAHKGTAIINVSGLVIGIASALVILAVIRFEISFDTFHTNADRTYRMVRVSGDDMSEFRTGISFPVPGAMKAEISSLADIVSMEYMGGVNVDLLDASGTSVRKFREESGCVLVEQGFFRVFDFNGTGFKWIAGNPESALKEPFSVVLTKTMARKYFGDANPVGETLRFQKKYDCKITGVIEDLPPNTDFPFTLLISYSTLLTLAGEEGLNDWHSVNDSHHTYIVLEPGASKSDMEAKIAAVHAAHTPKELHEFRHYLLQELGDVHHEARFGNYKRRTISKETLLGLALIGIFLIFAASINYINLATAQSFLRAKEIGLRKVMGSSRKMLVFQFLSETFLLVVIAGVIAMAVSQILSVQLHALLNLPAEGVVFLDPFMVLSWLGIIVVVTLFSGFYPSMVISKFNSVDAIKTKFSTQSHSGVNLRKVLVVAQFTITQILVVGTFIVVGQMRFFQNQDMGFNKEAILTARISDMDAGTRRVLEHRLRSQPFVSDVSFSFTLPAGVTRNRAYRDIGLPDALSMDDYLVYEYAAIDTNYLNLYQIPLLAGRNLFPHDTTGNIIINQTLAKNLGFMTPAEAIDQELKMGPGNVRVVGVIKDYYSNSLKQDAVNLVMLIREENYSTLSIKLNIQEGTSLPEMVKSIEDIWATTYPEFIFSYQFLDDNINDYYAQEQKFAKLFQVFSLVFLLIGCLGLYGLISFVVNRKGREVAIRKVFGATLSDILTMFSMEYVRLIALSFVIAVPVTYYLVNEWLSNFANHIQLHWWFFVIPGMVVLLIALVVVVTRSVGTAHANPVDKLKYE